MKQIDVVRSCCVRCTMFAYVTGCCDRHGVHCRRCFRHHFCRSFPPQKAFKVSTLLKRNYRKLINCPAHHHLLLNYELIDWLVDWFIGRQHLGATAYVTMYMHVVKWLLLKMVFFRLLMHWTNFRGSFSPGHLCFVPDVTWPLPVCWQCVCQAW